MPGGNRKGPQGLGSKTGRCQGYCRGSDTPGYEKRVPAGAGRKSGSVAVCRLRMGCREGQGFRHRRASMFESFRTSGARGMYRGQHYPAPSQEQIESEVELSEVEFFEKRKNLLKQELETLDRKVKTIRLQESGGQE